MFSGCFQDFPYQKNRRVVDWIGIQVEPDQKTWQLCSQARTKAETKTKTLVFDSGRLRTGFWTQQTHWLWWERNLTQTYGICYVQERHLPRCALREVLQHTQCKNWIDCENRSWYYYVLFTDPRNSKNTILINSTDSHHKKWFLNNNKFQYHPNLCLIPHLSGEGC